MNILHINFSDSGGGAEEFALSLSTHQPNAKLLVSKKRTNNKHVIEIPQTFRIRLFEFLDKVLWKLNVRTSFRSFFGFQNVFHGTMHMLRKLDVFREADVIHLHNIHGEFFDLKATSEIAKEKPIVWTSHDLWIATGGEGGLPEGLSHRERKKAYPLKGGWIDNRKRQLILKKKLLAQIDNVVVVAPSEDHKRNIQSVHPTASVKVIRLGIDSSIFNTQSAPKTVLSAPRVLIYNTTSIYKNSAEVISAIRKASTTFELHVLGDPIENLHSKKIVHHGIISDRKALAQLFRSIDIAVFSSRAETFGLLPAEVAACGAKVFLNASLPVFREHVDLYGATLFEDENHLAALIDDAVINIEETREEGMLIAEMVCKNFSRKNALEVYDRLYDRVCEGKLGK